MGEVSRQVADIEANNEGWRKWYFSNNRQDDFSYRPYLGKAAALLTGGKAEQAHKQPKDFNPKSIRKGMKVEREHTTNRNVQREIAMDHLTEDPHYYEKLQKMEKAAFQLPGKLNNLLRSLAVTATMAGPAKAGVLENLAVKPIDETAAKVFGHDMPPINTNATSKLYSYPAESSRAKEILRNADIEGSYHVTADTIHSTMPSGAKRDTINYWTVPKEGDVLRVHRVETYNPKYPHLGRSVEQNREVSNQEQLQKYWNAKQIRANR